jgi:hypothetical protein
MATRARTCRRSSQFLDATDARRDSGHRRHQGIAACAPEFAVPTATSQSDEETNEPLLADHRNFCKVEKWTRDGARVERMLYAGSHLDKAREVFAAAIYHRPRIRLTIRQRSHVLEQRNVTLCQPIYGERGHVRSADPERLEVGTEGHQQQYLKCWNSVHSPPTLEEVETFEKAISRLSWPTAPSRHPRPLPDGQP